MHIRKAVLKDASEIATLTADALSTDECSGLTGFLCPYGYLYPLSRRQSFLRRCKNRFYQGCDMFVMVSDETDDDWNGAEQILGHISTSDHPFTDPATMEQKINQCLHQVEDLFRWYLHLDHSTSHQRLNAFQRVQDATDLRSLVSPPGRDYRYIELLAVAPGCQKRGIGRTLMHHVQNIAVHHPRPVLLHSTLAGENLYLSCGFVEVKRVPLADGSDIQCPVMLWEPATSKGRDRS